jgi:hypothetical protein
MLTSVQRVIYAEKNLEMREFVEVVFHALPASRFHCVEYRSLKNNSQEEGRDK